MIECQPVATGSAVRRLRSSTENVTLTVYLSLAVRQYHFPLNCRTRVAAAVAFKTLLQGAVHMHADLPIERTLTASNPNPMSWHGVSPLQPRDSDRWSRRRGEHLQQRYYRLADGEIQVSWRRRERRSPPWLFGPTARRRRPRRGERSDPVGAATAAAATTRGSSRGGVLGTGGCARWDQLRR